MRKVPLWRRLAVQVVAIPDRLHERIVDIREAAEAVALFQAVDGRRQRLVPEHAGDPSREVAAPSVFIQSVGRAVPARARSIAARTWGSSVSLLAIVPS